MQMFEPPQLRRDHHAVLSLTLAEIRDDGYLDFSDSSWDFDAYDEEQRDRIWTKFYARYQFREIGIIPFARWKIRLIGKLNEIMPKYKWAYAAISGGVEPFQVEGRYNKSRSIDSDFPQTMLSGNEDYASFGRDFEHEEIITGDFLDKLASLRDASDIDVLILDELEHLFTSLITVNMNAW